MNNKLTWLFIISCFFLSRVTVAQENEKTEEEIPVETGEETEVEATEKNAKKENITLALRAGIDLFKPIRTQFDNQFQGIEFVGDLKVGERLYIASEIGSENEPLNLKI